MTLPDLFFAIACGALFYAGFCRLHKASPDMATDIVLAVWAVTVSSAIGLVAALSVGAFDLGYQPSWPQTLLALAMAGMWIAAGRRLWTAGAPGGYMKAAKDGALRRRESDRMPLDAANEPRAFR